MKIIKFHHNALRLRYSNVSRLGKYLVYTDSRIKMEGKLGRKFTTYKGSRQGHVKASGHFKVYVNPCLTALSESNLGFNMGSISTLLCVWLTMCTCYLTAPGSSKLLLILLVTMGSAIELYSMQGRQKPQWLGLNWIWNITRISRCGACMVTQLMLLRTMIIWALLFLVKMKRPKMLMLIPSSAGLPCFQCLVQPLPTGLNYPLRHRFTSGEPTASLSFNLA